MTRQLTAQPIVRKLIESRARRRSHEHRDDEYHAEIAKALQEGSITKDDLHALRDAIEAIHRMPFGQVMQKARAVFDETLRNGVSRDREGVIAELSLRLLQAVEKPGKT